MLFLLTTCLQKMCSKAPRKKKTLVTRATSPSHMGSAAARSSAAADGGATAVPWRSRAAAGVDVLRSRDCRHGLPTELGDAPGLQHVRERRLSDRGVAAAAGWKLGFQSAVFRSGCGDDDDVAAAGAREDHSLGRQGDSLPALKTAAARGTDTPPTRGGRGTVYVPT